MMTRCFLRAVLLRMLILQSICWCPAKGMAEARCDEFLRLVQDGKKAEALDLGESLFRMLAAQNPNSAALALLSGRLKAAQRIRTLATSAVNVSPTKLLGRVDGMDDLGLAVPGPKNRGVPATLPPSAQELYWTSLDVFTGQLPLDGLPPEQAVFFDRYYNLRMQDAIMRIGRHVVVADPCSVENTCYAMVLPLLYLCGRDNTWDQVETFLALFPPRQLDVLWRFSLVQAERTQASAQIARYQAQVMGRSFSLVAWAAAATDVCIAHHRPDLAQKSLQVAIDDTNDRNTIAALRLEIVESYRQCGDYATAARICRQTTQDLPDTLLYGRMSALYFGCLAREAKADQIVAETEPALHDARCQSYLPQILYLRWWALDKIKRPDEAVRVAQRLIEQYPNNPCVAPVLLERATDALARQQYAQCRELLTRLTRNFPGTESAKRAEGMLDLLRKNDLHKGQGESW